MVKFPGFGLEIEMGMNKILLTCLGIEKFMMDDWDPIPCNWGISEIFLALAFWAGQQGMRGGLWDPPFLKEGDPSLFISLYNFFCPS